MSKFIEKTVGVIEVKTRGLILNKDDGVKMMGNLKGAMGQAFDPQNPDMGFTLLPEEMVEMAESINHSIENEPQTVKELEESGAMQDLKDCVASDHPITAGEYLLSASEKLAAYAKEKGITIGESEETEDEEN